jgi:hypothetical protein
MNASARKNVGSSVMFFDSMAFTNIHVLISLVGIVAGLVVLYGLLTSRAMPAVTATFLLFTVLTSATGFLFPRPHLLPSHIVGIISLVLLAAAIYALYSRHLRGAWRRVYVITAVMSLYLNVFVLIVQSYMKVPGLHALAPKGSEPPFAITQGLVLLAFVVLGFLAVRRFHPATTTTLEYTPR